jgi:hypothetical protein
VQKLLKSTADELNDYQTEGVIGRALLSQFNLLLDFSKSVIFVTDQIHYLDALGYHLEKFIKIPFERQKGSIIFPIDLDIGEKKFILDTGCTTSIINSSLLSDQKFDKALYGIPIFTTSKFSIGAHDFGMMDLLLVKIFTAGILDGILGMDFLKTHVVYIDFDKKLIYMKQ